MKQKLPEGFKPGETILQLKRRLDELGYSQSTVRRLDSVWRNFTQYWNDSAQTEFTLMTMQQFMDIRYGYAMGDKDRSHNIRRAMNMLWDFAWYNQVFRQSSANTAQFRPEYRDAFEGFLSHLRDIGYSKGSLDTFRSQLFQIENFLHDNGCPGIGAIDEEQIKGYTAFLYRDSPVTVERKLRMLKRLLEYAYNNGYIESLLSPVGPKVRVPRNTHLHTTFTREEINALLAAVDRSNPLGKRDYAILVLSACLGLRISDIVGLTFDEIDWPKKRLCIVQQKTGNPVELPLTEETGWAIIDYLQNGRPQSNCDHVFVKHCAPYDALTTSMYSTFNKYLHKAGIKCEKPSGIHTLRHSLASYMLEQNIPLPVISGTLGHSDPHSTETYLSIAMKQLRECALEVEAL